MSKIGSSASPCYSWGPAGLDGEQLGQRKAHAVAKLLRDQGYKLWLDTHDLAYETAGGGVDDAMRRGIARSAAVICASAHYATRENCRLKAEAAAATGKPIVFVK